MDSVDEASDAARAGLQPGDVLVMADGELLPGGPNPTLPAWRPGQFVDLQVARDGVTHDLKFRTGLNQQISMQITEAPRAGPGELRVRAGWLEGVTHPHLGKP